MNDAPLAWFIGLLAGLLIGAYTYAITQTKHGGDAQACYPNRTCDTGLTCYSLGDDEFECRAKVEPAAPDTGRGGEP